MSTTVTDNAIRHTRGDTLRLRVIIEKDGEEYMPTDGEAVRFALKHRDKKADGSDYEDEEPILLKDIHKAMQEVNGAEREVLILELEPDDTKELAFGTYVYDIQLTFEDGTVDTFITASQFKITEEVD